MITDINFGSIPTQLRKVVKHCGYCGVEFTKANRVTIDHVKPKSKGGKDNIMNYIACCSNCNQSKGTQSYKQFVTPEAEEHLRNYYKELKGKKIDGVIYSKSLDLWG